MSKESTIFNISFIVTIICFIVIAAMTLNIVFGWGENHKNNHPTKEGCKKATSFKNYAERVDNMLCKDEYIHEKDFLNKYGSSMSENNKKCVDERSKLGGHLYENEILYCFKDKD